MTTAQTQNTIETIKNNISNYELYNTYFRLDEITETIRGHYLASTKEKIQIIKLNGLKEMFATLNGELLPQYKITENNEMFELHELNYKFYL